MQNSVEENIQPAIVNILPTKIIEKDRNSYGRMLRKVINIVRKSENISDRLMVKT